MMNGSYGDGMTSGGVWMMAIFGLLFLVLAGATIFWAIRATGSEATGPGVDPTSGSPRDVLDLRLARGEISREEYGSTRTLLGR
ncbi:MAG: hypothetical protein ABIW17_09115 [Marmoricola sp.]